MRTETLEQPWNGRTETKERVMHIHGSYVMREQVRDLVPSIMNYDVTRPARVRETRLHLLAVGFVTGIYLITAALAG